MTDFAEVQRRYNEAIGAITDPDLRDQPREEQTMTMTIPDYQWDEEVDRDEGGVSYFTTVETPDGDRLVADVWSGRRGWHVTVVHDDDAPDVSEHGRGSYEDALSAADELLAVEYRARVQRALVSRIEELTGETVRLVFRIADGANVGHVLTLDRCVPRDPHPGWSGVEGKRRYTSTFEYFVADDDVISIEEVT